MSVSHSRRRFLGVVSAAAAAAAWSTTRLQAAPAGKSVRLGAPLFNAPNDPEGLALAHRQAGHRAAYCLRGYD